MGSTTATNASCVFEAGAAHYAAFPGYPDPATMSPEDQALLSAPARGYQAYMRSMPRLGLAEAVAVRLSMYRDLTRVFGRCRALVTPTTGVPSVPADLPIEGATLEINGKPVDPVWDWCLTHPFNILGTSRPRALRAGFHRRESRPDCRSLGPRTTRRRSCKSPQHWSGSVRGSTFPSDGPTLPEIVHPRFFLVRALRPRWPAVSGSSAQHPEPATASCDNAVRSRTS